MKPPAKRATFVEGLIFGLTATHNEIRTASMLRDVGKRRDLERMRSDSIVSKYRKFLQLYDALRADPGEWYTVTDVARVTGLSARQSRRWISLFLALNHSSIEVEYGTPSKASRLRWRSA